MRVRVVVNQHAPQHEPHHGDGAKEVEYVRPTAGHVLNDETAQKISENVANLHTCTTEFLISQCVVHGFFPPLLRIIKGSIPHKTLNPQKMATGKKIISLLKLGNTHNSISAFFILCVCI